MARLARFDVLDGRHTSHGVISRPTAACSRLGSVQSLTFSGRFERHALGSQSATALVAGIVSAAASVSSFVGAKAFAGGDDDGGSAASQSLAVGALALIVLGAIGMSTTRLPAVEVRDEALNDIINRPIMTPLTSAPASTSAP